MAAPRRGASQSTGTSIASSVCAAAVAALVALPPSRGVLRPFAVPATRNAPVALAACGRTQTELRTVCSHGERAASVAGKRRGGRRSESRPARFAMAQRAHARARAAAVSASGHRPQQERHQARTLGTRTAPVHALGNGPRAQSERFNKVRGIIQESGSETGSAPKRSAATQQAGMHLTTQGPGPPACSPQAAARITRGRPREAGPGRSQQQTVSRSIAKTRPAAGA